ncbi:hypothetical protein M0802_010340 [Mischocyttarus mexicanus]|nr:hypothetical protein M0802_010340 [Mischocyttarus mexicanus]
MRSTVASYSHPYHSAIRARAVYPHQSSSFEQIVPLLARATVLSSAELYSRWAHDEPVARVQGGVTSIITSRVFHARALELIVTHALEAYDGLVHLGQALAKDFLVTVTNGSNGGVGSQQQQQQQQQEQQQHQHIRRRIRASKENASRSTEFDERWGSRTFRFNS